MIAAVNHRPVGVLLRGWREQRRLSQLSLALDAEISTRHLSFVETGRSQPSREMVLRLAEHLDVPLRERNHLLVAAGYAPAYGETALDAPEMATVRTALRQLLAGHEPYPALVVDRQWRLVDANSGLEIFLAGVAPELLTPPVNVLRLCLHPDGMAPNIVNLGDWREHILLRLQHHVAVTGDPDLTTIYEELRAFPGPQPDISPAGPAPSRIVMPLQLRHDGGELAFFSTTATFGTPLDVTVAELAIETFFPADDRTAAFLRARVR
jgi:transcriptional regulator with XRE-family HTH domain